VAIVQSNLKRMLAYSAIAHIGYMSLGLLAASPEGYAAALFYIGIYAMMSVGAFAILILLSKAGFEAEHISDLRGLNARSPWLAFMMLLVMFSMAGIPPTVGFFAKLGVLEALINAHMVWLATLALVFAIIGAYYYLNVVKVMYFEEPETIAPIPSAWDIRVAVSINGLGLLLLGLFPSALITVCRQAFALQI
jgi:NADH-quinone oxidoreductase subunit N